MVVVDSSVLIDFLRGTVNPPTDELVRLLRGASVRLVVPDLVLFELLHADRDFEAIQARCGLRVWSH